MQDEIAWLFNLRGSGETNNQGLMESPLFESTALVTSDQVFLWIHTQNVVPGLMVHLTPRDCELNKYVHVTKTSWLHTCDV